MILETATGQIIDSKDVETSRVLGLEKRLKFNGWLIFVVGLFFLPVWLLFFWREKHYQVQLKLKTTKDLPVTLLSKDDYTVLNSILASGDVWSTTVNLD